MEEKKKGSYWFIFSIADVIFIGVLLSILTSKIDLLRDPITGLHVRVGDYIIKNLAFPTYDIFSYTRPVIAWTPPEWLTDLIFAIVHEPFGLTGLVVFMAFVIAATYMLLFKFLRSSGVSMIVSVLTVAIAAAASMIHWLARPHIFSLLLMLVWYIILDTYQYKQKNYLYLLPFLMLLWVNLHSSYIMGFILLTIYIAGNFLKALFSKEKRSESSGRIKILVLFSFLCLLASFINPQGYKFLFSPFGTISSKIVIGYMNEWMSPNFHNVLIYEYMLLLIIVVLGLSIKRLNVIEVILILIFTHMSLFSARFIPLYAIIISPILGKQIDRIIEEFKDKGLCKEINYASSNMAAVDSRTRWHLWSIGAMAVAILICFTGKANYRFDQNKIPVDAVKFLKQEKIEGNVFNSDLFGSYIIYEAWPEYEVFYDGTRMYDKERTEEYIKVISIGRGWEDVLKKYDITWIIYKNESVLSNFLLQREDWHLVYSDKVANIFVKKTSENQPLISRYPNVKPAHKNFEEK